MTENRYEPPEMRGKRRVICHISEIAETGKGLSIKKIIKGDPDRSLDLFLVTDGDEVQGYFNICPHQGTPLDLKPDVFLDVEKKYKTNHQYFVKRFARWILKMCILVKNIQKILS